MTQNGLFTVLLIIILVKYGLVISYTNVTWEDAVKMCQEKDSVIEDSIDRIQNLSLPAGTNFWLPNYSAITPWIDLIGCFNTEVLKSYREVNATTLGFCQHLCMEETYFGFNRRKCVCISNVTLENQIQNMNCENPVTYKVYQVTDNNYEALDLGLCKIGRCVNRAPAVPTYKPLNSSISKCVTNSYGISGFCRNGHSLSVSNMQNEVIKVCESSYNSFLPNMLKDFCEKHGSKAQVNFWLSKFRLLYNGTQNKKDPKPVPVSLVKCSYGYFTDGRYSENVGSCLSMKSVLCRYNDKEMSSSTPSYEKSSATPSIEKSQSTPSNEKLSPTPSNETSPFIPSNEKFSTTPSNEKSPSTPSNEKSSSTPSNEKSSSTEFDNPLMTTHTSSYPKSVKLTGTITGCVIGVIIISATVITVIICRRSMNKKRGTKENIPVHFTVETHDDCDNQNIKELPYLPSYGIDTDTATHIYAKVIKKENPKKRKSNNTFSEACDGEYDHLNNFKNREIIQTENTYDSHEGMRSSDDFTYDSSDFDRRQLDDNNDDYAHAFPTTRTDMDYDCSTNVMTKRMNEYSKYMDN